MKLLMEYENVTPKVLVGNAVLAALMSERKYDIVTQNGDYSKESNVRYFGFSKKSSLSKCKVFTELKIGKGLSPDNAIRCTYTQFECSDWAKTHEILYMSASWQIY
jgi:hypothetical protein